jgi:biopolymer transport protein ExbB
VDQSESARLLGQLAALELALDRLEARLGGQRFRGEVLNPRGETVEGTVMAWGPSYYFSSLDGEWRGLLLEEVNTALPVLLPLESPRTEGLVAVASGRAGSLPLDPTLGDAVKLESTRLSVLGHIAQGKAIGYVILGLGLITLTVGIFKCVEIVRFPEIAPPVIGNIVDKMQSGDAEGALTEAQRVPGVPGEMLAAGVVHRELGGQVLEEMMFEKILRVRPMLERYLPFIALVAAAAPLLGLLGTVVGMIDTFRLITLFGTGDAAPLAGGIAKALVTTELGLLVAIPALVLHGFLTRLARRKLGLMEQAAVALINGAGLQPDEAKTEDGS